MEAISSAYTHQVKTVNLVNEDSMTEAKQLFLEKILPYKLIIRSHYNNLIISMRQQAKVEINNAQKASRVTMVVTVALLAIVFILSMWIQFLAFRATSRYNNLLVEHNDKLEHTVKVRTNELRVAKEEADRANTTKSKFLSAMSHELRTPMNAILGYGQLLEFDIDSFTDLQSENVKSIISAGHHLMTLINELQNLSKIESGKMELNIDALSLNDLFKKSISLIQPQAILRKIKVINNIGLHNYYVRADFTRLLQVFINLLSNAVKYGNDNSQVFLDPEEVNTNRIRIKVTNTGVGLSKKQIDKLFISFERLNESEGIEGTGLGLVITKSLIELMGGAVGVESTLGKSTTFWVELPLTDTP